MSRWMYRQVILSCWRSLCPELIGEGHNRLGKELHLHSEGHTLFYVIQKHENDLM